MIAPRLPHEPRKTEIILVIRVVLAYHLRTLAHVGAEVTLDVAGQARLRSPVTTQDALPAAGQALPSGSRSPADLQ